MNATRRGFLRLGLIALAAPAIVRASSIMPVRTARFWANDVWPSFVMGKPEGTTYSVWIVHDQARALELEAQGYHQMPQHSGGTIFA